MKSSIERIRKKLQDGIAETEARIAEEERKKRKETEARLPEIIAGVRQSISEGSLTYSDGVIFVNMFRTLRKNQSKNIRNSLEAIEEEIARYSCGGIAK